MTLDMPEIFAKELFGRGFRLREVCSVLAIEPERALELMLMPDTAAHLKRLAEVGEPASPIPDARRILEAYAYVGCMEIAEFSQACRDNGIDPGKQNIPAFLKAKTIAMSEYQRLAHPSLMELFAEAVRISKAKGDKLDHAQLRKQIAQAMQDIIESGGKKES